MFTRIFPPLFCLLLCCQCVFAQTLPEEDETEKIPIEKLLKERKIKAKGFPLEIVRLMPFDKHGKPIAVVGKFMRLQKIPQDYLTEYKESKYCLLEMDGENAGELPFVVPNFAKGFLLNKLVVLEKGTPILVTGKIKKFRVKSANKDEKTKFRHAFEVESVFPLNQVSAKKIKDPSGKTEKIQKKSSPAAGEEQEEKNEWI